MSCRSAFNTHEGEAASSCGRSVMKRWLVAALGAGVTIPAVALSLRYRRDMNAARARTAAVKRRIISTPWGAVEYAERGSGDPVLVVHGIFHNCVGGLLCVRELLTDRRVLAPATARLVSAVPEGFAMTSEDGRFVTEFIDSLFPMSVAGVMFDACVSNADVNNYNLEAISVPTLIVHTKDDQLASHDASRRAAARIPGARFVSLESGGHLMVGQTTIVRNELADFFAGRKDRRAERVAS